MAMTVAITIFLPRLRFLKDSNFKIEKIIKNFINVLALREFHHNQNSASNDIL